MTTTEGSTMATRDRNPYSKMSTPLSIRFTDEQWTELRAHHEETGAPLNEIVRRAVTAYLRAIKKMKERAA